MGLKGLSSEEKQLMKRKDMHRTTHIFKVVSFIFQCCAGTILEFLHARSQKKVKSIASCYTQLVTCLVIGAVNLLLSSFPTYPSTDSLLYISVYLLAVCSV